MTGTDDTGTHLSGGQLQDRAVKGVAWTMIHTLVSLPVAFLVNLLLARVLDPEGYGRLAFLTTLITLVASVLALGLAPAMVQFGAKAHARGHSGEVRRILSASQGFRLLVVAPVVTLLVLLLVDVPLALLALAIVFGVWVPAALNGAPVALTIENRTAAGAKITMVSNLVVQAGVVTAVLWLGTADAVWATRVVLTAVGIGLALVTISRAYRRAVLRPRLPRGFPPGFWKFALPTGAAGLIGELVVSRTEVLFLEWLSTPSAVGLFALAFGVSNHVFAPAQALTGPLIPAISGLREVGPDKVAEALHRTLRATSTIVALLTTSAVPALALLVPVLYGTEYAAAAPAVLALGVVGGFSVATGPLSAFILARLSARLFLMANTTALVVDVGLALALIPGLGLWGAVISNGAGILTRLTILFVTETRDVGLSPSSAVGMVVPTFVGGAACVAAWFLGGLIPVHEALQAVVAAGVALTLLFLGMRATRTGMSPRDRDAILNVAPARLRPFAGRILALVTRSQASGPSGR